MAETSEPRRRVGETAKQSVYLSLRITRSQADLLRRRVQDHDPPTVAAWLRDLIAGELRKDSPPPAG